VANVIEILINATDAASAQIRGVQAATTELGESTSRLSSLLLGPVGIAAALAAAGIAAGEMGNKLAEEVEQLNNMSARTGASVNDLRALRQVMVETGQSPEILTQALTIANKNLGAHADALAKVGITAKTPIEALLQLSDMVTKSGNSATTTAAAFTLLGRGGGALIPILNGLRDSLKDVHSRLGDLSPATLAAAESWDKMMHHIGTSTKAFLDGVGAQFLRFVKTVTDMAASPDLALNQVSLKRTGGAPTSENTLEPFETTSSRLGNFDRAAVWLSLKNNITVEQAQKLWDSQKNIGAEHLGAFGALGGMTPVKADPKAMGIEDWQKAADMMLGFFPKIEKVKKGIEGWALVAKDSADLIASDFRGMFADIFTYGANVFSALGNMLKNLAAQIASIAAQIATGLALNAIGSAFGIPFLGKIGGILAGKSIGQQGGGSTVVIQTLDTRTLRMQMQMPHGSWARANQELGIGRGY
jgi:hypothetical protein